MMVQKIVRSRAVSVLLSLVVLLSLMVVPVSAAYSASAPAAGKVVTDRDPLNVRAGAGTKYRVVGQADKGSYLQVVGTSGSFYKVVYNGAGKTGYVSKSYLKIVSTGVAKVTTQRDPLVLRKTASASGKNLAQIPKGTMVPILKKNGNWYQVVYQNKIGYCSATYLTVNGKTPAAKTTITFSDISNPGTIQKGTGVHISGTIRSTNSKLSSITVSIRNSSGRAVMSKTVKPNTHSYKIYNSDLDWAMSFGNLSTGSYTLCYEVRTVDGTKGSTSRQFSVRSSNIPSETGGYDADAALGYARRNWNRNPEQQCAEFVSRALKEGGGINSIQKGVGGLKRALESTSKGKLCQLTVEADGRIKLSKNADKLSPGDPILTYCTREKMWPHAVLFSSTDSGGYVRVYAHNSAKNNETFWGFSRCNGGCPASGTEIRAYSYHYQ